MLQDPAVHASHDPALTSACSPAPFTFAAGPFAAGRLRVLSFKGREAVSRPYRFDVEIGADASDAHDVEPALLGQAASLTMLLPEGERRTVAGIVAAVEAQGAFEQGRHAFRVRVVPRLWLLGKRKTSRIFQDKSVPEMVAAVLADAGVPHRAALSRRYPPRVYCVQYQETDLAFVTRLCAEEGIFYVFEHAAEEMVVFGDGAHAYEPIGGDAELAYRYEHGADGLVPKEHHVGRFVLRRALKTGAVLQRDYDFRRPMLDLRAEAKPSSSPPASAAADNAVAIETDLLHDYDHHGEDERPDVDGGSAGVRLEQRRRHATVAEGASACRRLSPGLAFDLVDHDVDALNGRYVLARVEHVGRAPEVARGRERVYENTFACVPADVALRPKRPRRVLQQVMETAVVVGPAHEEIYTDEHGRVKVQFPWDLAGKKNEHSSCWVRVAQAWAGAGWGFSFVPRIGMEVVVTFVGGDVDRPLVTGCVPNAVNVPPFVLPGQRTRSGIRTRTTPGGDGSNELCFEDAAGREQVFLHAQRNLDEVVENDHTRTVRGNEAVSIGKRSTVDVGGDQETSVKGNEVINIDKNLVLHVGGRQIIHVDGQGDDGPEDVDAAQPPASEPVEKQTNMGGTRSSQAAGAGTTRLGAGGVGSIEGGSGSARGGGGADVKPWTRTGNGQPSELNIAKGGGVINSPDGLTFNGQGGHISIKDGVMTLSATTIELTATTIRIVGDETIIKGTPIRLN
jgi:type VI secretion system secreted protein VgrG